MNDLVPLSTKKTALIETLKAVPIDLVGENFIHINDSQQSFIITQGEAYLFLWLYENGLATGDKHYVCTLSTGDLIVGSNDYFPKNSNSKDVHYGLYLALDHNTKIISIQSDVLFANKSEIVADMIDDFVRNISIVTETFSTDSSLLAVGQEHEYLRLEDIAEDEETTIVWMSSKNIANLPERVEQTDQVLPVVVHLELEKYLRTGTGSSALLANQDIHKLLLYFLGFVKEESYRVLADANQSKQESFDYTQSIQKKRWLSILSRLHDAYHGHADILPADVIIDDSLGINKLVNTVCALTNTEPTLSQYQSFKKLDHNNINHIEEALKTQGFGSRSVILRKDWHKNNRWVLIATLKEENKTTILSRSGHHYHYYNLDTNHWEKITENNAQDIAEEALMIYRPLPDEPIQGGMQLFKRGLFFSRRDTYTILITGIVIGLINLVTPVVTGKLLASALPNYDISLMHGYLLAMLSAAIGVLVFQFVNSISILRLESKFALDIHASIWMRLLRLPLRFFKQYSTGDLANRANIIDDIHGIWSAATTTAILSLFSMISSFALLFYYSLHLASLVLVIFVVIGFGVVMFYKLLLPILNNIYEHKTILTGIIFQLLTGVSKLRVAAKEYTALTLWSNRYNKLVVNNRKFMLYNAIMKVFVQSLPLLFNIIIFSFIFYALYEKAYNIGFNLADFLSFNAAFGQLISALVSISAIFINIIMTVPMLKLAMPILKAEIEVEDNKTNIEDLKGSISLSKVFFKYREEGSWVLNNLSMDIHQGEYVAIVGHSGSGKSTIAKLIMGLEQVELGTVFVDNLDMREIKLSSLRSKIGIVLQNSSIIPGSIFDNIVSSNSNITTDDVWHALELVGMKALVERLPMTIHTILSETGGGFSGGEMQRLVIARVLATQPSVLVFDEATSAMDNITQRLIQETLEKMNVTRIVIAHRLSTIINAHRIYALSKGEVVEMGNYEELMAKQGYFYQLVKRQQ